MKKEKILFLLFLVPFLANSQSLIYEINSPDDHRYIKGFLNDDELMLYGAIGFVGSPDEEVFGITLNSNDLTVKQAPFWAPEKGAYIKVMKTDQSYLVANSTFDGNQYLGMLKRYTLNGQCTDSLSFFGEVEEMIISMDQLYISGTLIDVNAYERSFFVYKISPDFTLLESIELSKGRYRPIFISEFLEHNDDLYLFHNAYDSLGTYLSAYRFSNATIQDFDSIFVVNNKDIADEYNASHMVPSVTWDVPGVSVYVGLTLYKTVGFQTYNEAFGFCNYNLSGEQLYAHVVDRPDTTDWFQGENLDYYTDRALVGWTVANFGDDAFNHEEFIYGNHPTVVDVHLFDRKTKRLKHWEIFNGEYITVNDIVTDSDNDRCFVVCTSYDFNDSISGKKRDLLVYEISGIDQYMDVDESFIGEKHSRVYPNPASDFLNISLPTIKNTEGVIVQLYNEKGQVLKEFQYHMYEEQRTINISQFSPGFYFIHLSNGTDYSEVHTFVKQ